MVVYVAFISITNLCIGFALAHWVQIPSRTVIDSAHSPDRDSVAEDYESEETTRSEGSYNLGIEPYIAKNENVNGSENDTPSQASDKKWLRSESGFATELHDITERAKYGHSLEDKNLTRESASQLTSCIGRWYDELQQLLADPGNYEIDPADDRLAAVEMCSAQIETSISNLRALDWSTPFDEVWTRLEIELGLLSDQQRSISRLLNKQRASD